MIESPTKPVAASPDDRPIVVGRVEMPDFYLLAHEAKNRGQHGVAVSLLMLAALDLEIAIFPFGDVILDWESHIEAIDKAWGEKQKQLLEHAKPAPNPVQIMRVAECNLFIDAVRLHDSGRPVAAATLLLSVANDLEVEGDWTGTFEQDWERNFENVHRAWVELWSKLNG